MVVLWKIASSGVGTSLSIFLILSEIGFPIYSVQGRDGGYRLLQERILTPIAFSKSEAMVTV
jgi:hypothetical protein